jgi:hypothetical protein
LCGICRDRLARVSFAHFGGTAVSARQTEFALASETHNERHAVTGGVKGPLAVVREGPQPKTVVTKFKRISVTVAPGQTHVQFVDIEEGLRFPMPSRSELDAYVVYVGFDEIGDKNEKKPHARKTATWQQ